MAKEIFPALLATAMSLVPAAAWACAVCLTGASDSADGFNASVLFLMATPYVVLGSIAGALVIAYRRSLKRRVESEAEEGAIGLAWNREETGR